VIGGGAGEIAAERGVGGEDPLSRSDHLSCREEHGLVEYII
jgi:hypothetical protein